MDRVFIDTNVLVDWLTQRPPFAEHSTKIVELIERRLISGVVNPLVLANTYYVTATYLDKITTHRVLSDMTSLFEIIDVCEEHVRNAVKEDAGDFEDEIHIQTMAANDIQIVITRNTKDFTHKSISPFTPVEYLESLRRAGAL
jgi:predicted nucleic acid-binding protein